MKWRFRILFVICLSVVPFVLVTLFRKPDVNSSTTLPQSSGYQRINDINNYGKDGLKLKFKSHAVEKEGEVSDAKGEKTNTFEFLDRIANGDKTSTSGNAKPELHVIVFNHAHTDPGWYWTMEEYYNMKTRHILDNLVVKLDQYPNMTFVWAETVFLAKWWEKQSLGIKNKFKRFIQRKQLEIVSGGWVLPDEATSHYFSLINQFGDGHHWLKSNLGLVPKNVWSIDPFGYSTTLAYLRKQAGFNNMVIDRVDRSVKEILWEKKMLEFYWRQPWDIDRSTDIATHVMPYFSYTTMHSCGPDFEFCRTMDFKDHPIQKLDIDKKANKLVDELRKKSLLFRYNTLFMMIGRDFGFDNGPEWDNQYQSYSALMDVINRNKDWNVNIRFGTLEDYFTQVKKVASSENRPLEESLPVIQGDFLPYRDKNMDYWTGYFTSRPHHKRLSRQTQEVFRAASAMTSLLLSDIQERNPILLKNMFDLLQRSSYNISLFQHHDAITGTSSAANMDDYRMRLTDALTSSQTVLENSIEFISAGNGNDQDAIKSHQGKGRSDLGTLVVVNASPKQRSEVVSYVLRSRDVSLGSDARGLVKCQVTPFDRSLFVPDVANYILDFEVQVHPFESTFYTVSEARDTKSNPCVAAEVQTQSDKTQKTENGVVMENEYLEIKFFPDDRLEVCLTHTDVCVDIVLSWHFYKPGEGTGAYILRDLVTENTQHEAPPKIRIVRGVLFSEIQITHRHVKQHFRLYHGESSSARSIEVLSVYDISTLSDTELVLRMATSIKNSNREFHTDSNGYQILRRKYRTGLPICANFYPMTSSVMIEDTKQRLTLHSGQSHSVSSMEVGSIDVLMDRRSRSADDKGMGQGITDNSETTSKFILQLEKIEETRRKTEYYTLPSFAAMVTNDFLQNPLLVFKSGIRGNLISAGSLIHSSELPCSVEIAHMRLVPDTETGKFGIGLTFHNRNTDSQFRIPSIDLQCSQDSNFLIKKLFKSQHPTSIHKTTLTYLEVIREIGLDEPIDIKPMEMASFYIRVLRSGNRSFIRA